VKQEPWPARAENPRPSGRGEVKRAAPFGFTKVVFLSHVLGPGGPVFPGDPPVEVHPAATIERDGCFLESLVTGEQSGTHWAAPAHFRSGHAAADELDPGDFFSPAVVLDVRAPGAEDADFTLGRPEIEKWEANFGPIPPNSAVIMWTGFEDRWDDPPAYLNADPAGGLHYPGFGAQVTSWLIEHHFIGPLGIDTIGIDPGADSSFRANQLLLAEHRIHLENLAGLSEMPSAGGWIIVGGIRIRGGSGSPATVFGLVP
jgi:kynurenine formamidase